MALTEIQRIKQKEYRKKVGLEKYREQRRAYQKEWTRKNPDYRKNMRIKCLSHYGGNPAKCACCEEKTYEFLGIDHINGKGNKHRKEVGTKKDGGTIYQWIIRNNFPPMFQVLCHNCNLAKGFYGNCPHKVILPK